MNLRQRFLEVMRFNRDVHTVKWEFGYWGETIKNWYESGLPEHNYPKLPTQVTTPTSSLYIPAWTCRSKTVLPNGMGVMAGGLYWPTQGFPLDTDVREKLSQVLRYPSPILSLLNSENSLVNGPARISSRAGLWRPHIIDYLWPDCG